MKNNITSFARGFVSSLLHSIGFVKLAEKLDPLMAVSNTVADRRSSSFSSHITNFRPV